MIRADMIITDGLWGGKEIRPIATSVYPTISHRYPNWTSCPSGGDGVRDHAGE